MVHQLARSKLQIPCPQCFEILKRIDTQRFACDNPKCHLLEVTALISYSDEKCEAVYQYKRKEWVDGKTKSDYVLLDREQLSDIWKIRPQYEDLDPIGGMEDMGTQMFGVNLDQWYENLAKLLFGEEPLEKGGE